MALAVAETIESQHGSDGIIRLLEAQRTESSQEAALRQGLRMNFSELGDATVRLLEEDLIAVRKKYLQCRVLLMAFRCA
jgi:hypothetical protein